MAAPLRVFLSYSRKDSDFVDRLHGALQGDGIEVLRDVDDILPAEQWRGRLEQLISGADGIVFVLSPTSVSSEVCAWEVARAVGLGKRLVPVLARAVDAAAVPGELAARNWLDMRGEGGPTGASLEALTRALRTDVDWVREHTRLTELAQDWLGRGEASDVLLRGAALAQAEQWLASRPSGAPECPETLRRFLAQGRSRANRLRTRVTVGAVLVALVAVGLAAFAEVNRRAANQRKVEAEAATAEARRQEARTLSQLSAAERERGETGAAIASALRAVEITGPDLAPPEVEEALYRAVFAHRLVASRDVEFFGRLVAEPDGGVTAQGDGETLALDPTLQVRPPRPRPSAAPPNEVRCGEQSLQADWYSSLVLHEGDGDEQVRLVAYITNMDYAENLSRHAAFAPDCRSLVLSGGHDPIAWEQPTVVSAEGGVYSGQLLARLGGHSGAVGAVAAGPGGRFFTWDPSGTVRAWDLDPTPDGAALARHRGAALHGLDPGEFEDPTDTFLPGLDKLSALSRGPDGALRAVGSRAGEVALPGAGDAPPTVLARVEGEILAVNRHDGLVRFVAARGLGSVPEAGGPVTWEPLPPLFADCWEVVIDPRLDTLHCAGAEDPPAIHRLTAPSDTLQVFPQERIAEMKGLGNSLRIVAHPDCPRGLVTFGGQNVDLPYKGGAVYVDFAARRVIAEAPRDRTLPAFCTLADLAGYASEL